MAQDPDLISHISPAERPRQPLRLVVRLFGVVALITLAGGFGMATGRHLDPFTALVARNDGVLIVAHGCGFSMEAVADLRATGSPTNEVVVVYVDPKSHHRL